jgi:glyoxylate reductase
MAKVVITARLPGRVDEILAGHELVRPVEEAQFSAERVRAEVADADALLPLLSVRVDDSFLAAAPRLRIVANYAVGYDNVDLAAATRRGVAVTNTPDVLTAATADLTLALLLAAARRLPEATALVRAGAWSGWEPEQLVGLDLDGARLGVVGPGRIGRAVAERARAFGMVVCYSGPRAVDGFARLPLDELLASADVVSLHCPLNAETHHLIGARELSLMKPTALLINTARGAIVDEVALADALERGHLGGVGLDVFEHEPRITPRLTACPRAVLTPHVGSATRGARARMAESAAQSIADFLDGRRPAHLVNPAVLTPPER